MKLLYTTKDGRMTVELEADTQADIWRELASFQEVFEDRTCVRGKKTTDEVKFVVRKNADEDEFFEMHYSGNDPEFYGCKKAFGQNKKPKGQLYPQRS